MDCPSEESLIRLALQSRPEIRQLRLDLEQRTLVVIHDGPARAVLELLEPLGLGARLETTEVHANPPPLSVEREGSTRSETRALWLLLCINATMFAIELGVGLAAESTGLVADAFDMFADALVYGLSLHAVGRSLQSQRRAAKASGAIQLLLGLVALSEVARRSLTGSEPVESWMIGVGLLALVANLSCVALLARHREGGVHLRASWIFTTNDALANLGVVLAGVLVALTGSAVPDLVIGTLVALLVLSGATRILRLPA